MAVGDYNNGDNNKKKYYEPVLYSPYGTSNTDGVDPSALSYQFYNGMLKISISPMKAGAKPDDRQIWDHDNGVSAWITHAKARMLLSEFCSVMGHPDEVNNGGVPTGTDGLISFSNGKELGVSSPCLIIRKIDPDSGAVQSVYAYQFKDTHYGSIRNFNPNDPKDFEHINYPRLEIDELISILGDYSKAIGGAYSYAALYAQRFDINRNNTKIGLIMEKLGIETNPDYANNQRTGNNKSFFNNNSGKDGGSMRNTTLGQLENEIE